MCTFISNIFGDFAAQPIEKLLEEQAKKIFKLLEQEYMTDLDAKNAAIDTVIKLLQDHKNPPNQG